MGFVPPALPRCGPPPFSRGELAPLLHTCHKCGARLLIEEVRYTEPKDERHLLFPDGKMEAFLRCPERTWLSRIFEGWFTREHGERTYFSADGGASWHLDLGVSVRI